MKRRSKKNKLKNLKDVSLTGWNAITQVQVEMEMLENGFSSIELRIN